MSGAGIHVHILTHCRKARLFYGTELIFHTLRVGFPNARVTVVDNASLEAVRPAIARLAQENDCAFDQIPAPGVDHGAFIEDAIAAAGERDDGTVLFLDPDICLWESCEHFEFEGLMAGQLVEAYDDTVMRCVTMPRLHSSFLWIPDARRLADEIRRLRGPHIDFRPFQSVSIKLRDVWIRYDTGASLFAALPDQMSIFTREHLSCYDHLVSGSHIDLWEPHLEGPLGEFRRRAHGLAKNGDMEGLRRLYQLEEEGSSAATPDPPTEDTSE